MWVPTGLTGQPDRNKFGAPSAMVYGFWLPLKLARKRKRFAAAGPSVTVALWPLRIAMTMADAAGWPVVSRERDDPVRLDRA